MLMVWDLNPDISLPATATPSSVDEETEARPQPTAYVINFPHPLTTVCSHPTTSKEFLVADSRGSIFLTDWRSDPDENEQVSWRNSSVIELIEPRALADSMTGSPARWAGSVAWRRDSTDMYELPRVSERERGVAQPLNDSVGAIYGTRFSLWDISKLQGGKPAVTVSSFPEGGTKFRFVPDSLRRLKHRHLTYLHLDNSWCPSHHEYFAVTTNSPAKGAVIHVHNTNYINAQPTVFQIASRPLYVRDFDFIAEKGIPRIVAAVGREVIIFYIGVES